MNDSPTSRPTGDGDPTSEGVVHLQRAAREMVAAARSFLDAIEQVVEDRDALKEVSTMVTGMAATVGDALGDAVRGRSAPWVDAAGAEHRGDVAPEGPGRTPGVPVDDAESDGPDSSTEDWAQPLVDPDAPRRPSRVRRIAVD